MSKFSMLYKKPMSFKAKMWRMVTTSALALILGLSTPLATLGSPLDDVRFLLEQRYVDSVDPYVLNANNVDEMLKRLEDPYTVFFTEEEYQKFLDSMELSFSGIGVHIQVVPQGLEIVSVIEGSPAMEAELRSGDIITEVAGKSLAGLPQEMATSLVRGPEGSTVDIVVLRGEERLNLKVTRRTIEMPTVTGEMLTDEIGYVSIESFGESTVETFGKVVKALDEQGADAWIMDLRNNPGGYLTAALGMAGYFIGDQTALQTKDSSQQFTPDNGIKQEFMITEPVIFLTNHNSASASEILTAVVKDYQKAVVVGTNTYGKGSVQSLYQLTDGDVLKITVAKFYSPYGKEIDGVGISPDVLIRDTDPVEMAQLMLANSEYGGEVSEERTDRILFTTGGKDWEISLEQARDPEYWSTYREFVQNNTFPGGFSWWNGTELKSISDGEQEALWPLFYPGYTGMNELKDLSLDKTFTVRFTGPIDFASVTAETIELIDSDTGERTPVRFEQIDERSIKVIPAEQLKPQQTYWLLTHQGIIAQDGTRLREGALTPVTTK